VVAFTDRQNSAQREYFTFSEKLEWARRLERIERVKAEERMKAGKALDPVVNCPQGKTRDIVAEKSGFGSSSTYRRAKYIAENADPETIAKLDADEISIHRAWKETKARINENCDQTVSEICHVAQIDHTENSAGQETGGNPKDVFRFKEAEANKLRYVPFFAPVRWRRMPFGTKSPYDGAILTTCRCYYSRGGKFSQICPSLGYVLVLR